jgi:hypothetical protein
MKRAAAAQIPCEATSATHLLWPFLFRTRTRQTAGLCWVLVVLGKLKHAIGRDDPLMGLPAPETLAGRCQPRVSASESPASFDDEMEKLSTYG